MQLSSKFQKIHVATRNAAGDGSQVSASIVKDGSSYALNIFIPGAIATSDYTYAECYVNHADRQIALRMNNDTGYKLMTYTHNTDKRIVRIPALKADLRQANVRVGVVEELQRKDEFLVITLPDIYWNAERLRAVS